MHRPEETERLVAKLLPPVPMACPDPQCGDSTWDHDCQAGRSSLNYPLAQRLLAALADTGMLVPQGSRRRVEYAYRYKGFKKKWTNVVPCFDRAEAYQARDDFLEAFPVRTDFEAQVLTREIIETDWEPEET